MCRCKSLGYLKDFSQNEQALITWTLKCFLSNQRLPIFINKKIQTNTDIKFKTKYKSQKDREKGFNVLKAKHLQLYCMYTLFYKEKI